MSVAIAYGAVTIVNAIATGKGAAFGIDLETKARVELNKTGEIKARIKEAPEENTKLAEFSAKAVLEYFGLDYGADIETESNIPIAKGLKSSSAASNAIVLATAHAICKEKNMKIPEDKILINLGVDAAIKSGVSITGALDDASASFLGGCVVTDNTAREIVKSSKLGPLKVLLFIPEKKSYTRDVDVEKTKMLSKGVEIAWKKAFNGDIYSALTLNGLLYSLALNEDPEIALIALKEGALASGLCGTGPAVSAVVKENPERIKKAWEKFEGDIMEVNINNKRAEAIE